MSAEALVRLQSRTVCLPERNIDTDRIIPARFLTTTCLLYTSRCV